MYTRTPQQAKWLRSAGGSGRTRMNPTLYIGKRTPALPLLAIREAAGRRMPSRSPPPVSPHPRLAGGAGRCKAEGSQRPRPAVSKRKRQQRCGEPRRLLRG
jgi:hypothetical protein